MKIQVVKVLSLFLLSTTPLSANESLTCNGKTVLGLVEKIRIEEPKIVLTAKLDTGANTSSLCAEDIQIMKVNNQRVVRFSVCGIPINQKITAPLYKFVSIRSRHEENFIRIKRPVIRLKIKMGSQVQTISINLTDRSQFTYPMLLGREALIQLKIVVDPSI